MKKLRREVRLAYLCELLHRRLTLSKNVKSSWIRHYQLTTELSHEKILNELSAFQYDNRLVRFDFKGNNNT